MLASNPSSDLSVPMGIIQGTCSNYFGPSSGMLNDRTPDEAMGMIPMNFAYFISHDLYWTSPDTSTAIPYVA